MQPIDSFTFILLWKKKARVNFTGFERMHNRIEDEKNKRTPSQASKCTWLSQTEWTKPPMLVCTRGDIHALIDSINQFKFCSKIKPIDGNEIGAHIIVIMIQWSILIGIYYRTGDYRLYLYTFVSYDHFPIARVVVVLFVCVCVFLHQLYALRVRCGTVHTLYMFKHTDLFCIKL